VQEPESLWLRMPASGYLCDMDYSVLKSLHIIFVVTWFAGLFYIVRLFIYFREAADMPEPEKQILQQQYLLMQKRLWFGITWPSAVLTLILGATFVWQYYWPVPDWLQWKLAFVAGLFLYHFFCHAIFKQQQRGELRYTSNQLRIWNEVATLFLVAIVFLVVMKNALNMLWGLVGFVAVTLLLLIAIRIYRRARTGR
jgi:putative membrane protein